MAEDRSRTHEVLVDRDRLAFITVLPAGLAHAFATEYAEAAEFEDRRLVDWLDQHLLMLTSEKGGRAADLVNVLRREKEDKGQGEERIVPKHRSLEG